MEDTFNDRFIRGFQGLEEFTGIKQRTLRDLIPDRLKIRPGPRLLLFRESEVVEFLESFRQAPQRDIDELVDGVISDVLGNGDEAA